MTSFSRNPKTVVRLVAAGFLLVGVLNLAAYGYKLHHTHDDLNILRCLWLSIPLVVGIVILIKTSALAERLEAWLDE